MSNTNDAIDTTDTKTKPKTRKNTKSFIYFYHNKSIPKDAIIERINQVYSKHITVNVIRNKKNTSSFIYYIYVIEKIDRDSFNLISGTIQKFFSDTNFFLFLKYGHSTKPYDERYGSVVLPKVKLSFIDDTDD